MWKQLYMFSQENLDKLKLQKIQQEVAGKRFNSIILERIKFFKSEIGMDKYKKEAEKIIKRYLKQPD